MKKNIILKVFVFAFAWVLTGSCEKDKTHEKTQELVFGIEHIDPSFLKADGAFDIPCPLDKDGNILQPGIAEISLIDMHGVSTTYELELMNIQGKFYTKVLRLTPGTYTVSMFLLRTAPGGTIVMATPKEGSDYAAYITPGKRIAYSFEVGEFTKTEVDAEVLCFEQSAYNAFGFFWFNINQIVIKEVCFFGDICANNIPTGYQSETAYCGNTNGSGNPWWYYFDASIEGPQHIYAGQNKTDGYVEINGNQMIINLGSWILQDVAQPVKIKGFDSAPLKWVPPGQFDVKTNQLTIDLSGYSYPYYIIHLDVRKSGTGSSDTPFTPEDFAGSLYEKVPGGLQMDMPAIFKLHVYKEGTGEVPYSPFSNVLLNAKGDPLPIAEQPLDEDGFLAQTSSPVCARYPVGLQESQKTFIFQLFIWVPKGDGTFYFRHFYTFTANDRGPLLNHEGDTQPITHGIIDFVVGNCNYFPPDLQLIWE